MDMPTTQQFSLRPNGFQEVRKAAMIKTLPIFILMALGVVAIGYFNTRGQTMHVGVFPLFSLLFVGLLAFGMYRGINRQKKLFESYRILFDEYGITREQANTPTLTIPFTHIREIVKNANGSFTILGDSMINAIGVPAQIDEYEELERVLAGIQPLSIRTSEPIFQKFAGFISVLVLGLMAIVYLATNKLLVGISGAALLLMLGYSFFVAQKSKNIDNKTRKTIWWSLVVVASIIAILYHKLFA